MPMVSDLQFGIEWIVIGDASLPRKETKPDVVGRQRRREERDGAWNLFERIVMQF